MRLTIELDEATIKKAVLDHVETVYGIKIPEGDLIIQVKSKQNYKSEWEVAAFRGSVTHTKLANHD